MQDFFKSTKFKIILVVILLLSGLIISSAFDGMFSYYVKTGLNYIVSPFVNASTAVSEKWNSFIQHFDDLEEMRAENEELKEQVKLLTDQLINYEAFQYDTEQYENYLSLKHENEDYEYVPAMIIGRDITGVYGSFTIDVGSRDGVDMNDPVVTTDGVVGIVTAVTYTNCTVTTVLDADINIGVYEVRTLDTGVITGAPDLAPEGYSKLTLLSRDSSVISGDTLVTSGIGGVFPKGLVVGSIYSIRTESHGISSYAIVKPAVDVYSIKEVFVITSFDGQGSLPAQSDTSSSDTVEE